MNIFDRIESQLRKDTGMKVAAENRSEALAVAREVALALGAQKIAGVTADDVKEKMMEMRLQKELKNLGPAAGSIFKTQDWEWTGRFKPSENMSNHGRLLRVWRLKVSWLRVWRRI